MKNNDKSNRNKEDEKKTVKGRKEVKNRVNLVLVKY